MGGEAVPIAEKRERIVVEQGVGRSSDSAYADDVRRKTYRSHWPQPPSRWMAYCQ